MTFLLRSSPKSDCYPYKVHYLNALSNAPSELKNFHLVGRSWKENSDMPFALAFGFDGWKLGFISDYLPNYRLAFAPKQRNVSRDIKNLQKNPSAIFVWHKTSPNWLIKYAKINEIPFFQISSGFIHSANPTPKNTTPYSLVIDEEDFNIKGKTSKLVKILNEYDFSKDKHLLKQAKLARKTLIDNKIFKYNPPILFNKKNNYMVKTAKRILILDQKDKNYTNPKSYSLMDLYRLARSENPNAEIFYKPLNAKYVTTNSLFKKLVTIIPSNIAFADLLDNIDHVYTISAPNGLEVIIRDIKLTIFGTPFYAGWGLTNDLIKIKNRKRTLNIDEFFAGTYIKHPTYLADIENSFAGFQTTCMRIVADRTIRELTFFDKQNVYNQKLLDKVATSNLWEQLLLNPIIQSKKLKSLAQKTLEKINLLHYLREIKGELSKKTIIFLIAGWIENEKRLDKFLTQIRTIVSKEAFKALLHGLHDYRPGSYLLKHFSWMLEDEIDTKSPAKYIEQYIANKKKEQQQNNALIEAEGNIEIDSPIVTDSQALILLDLMNAQYNGADYEAAKQTIFKLLISGHANPNIILMLANIAITQFDDQSCYDLANMLCTLGLKGPLNKAVTLISRTTKIHENDKFIKDMALYYAIKPEKLVNTQLEIYRRNDKIDSEKIEQYLLNFLRMDNNQTAKKALGYIAASEPTKAVEIIKTLLDSQPNTPQLSVLYAKALAADQKIERAKKIIDAALAIFPTLAVYKEAMNITVAQNDSKRGLELLKEAKERKFDVGNLIERTVYYVARMPFEAQETFKQLQMRSVIQKHYPKKYCLEPFKAKKDRKFLGVSIFGPGDEIRYASIYNLLEKRLPHKEIEIGCSPRLLTLMQRSFKNIDFVPIHRLRNSDEYENKNYDKIRSSALIGALDNKAVQHIKKCDDFCLITDILSDVLPSYKAFPGTPYLKDDEEKTQEIKNRLPKGKVLVGLSWRSSLTSQSRIKHYLTIEELAPILKMDNVQFVNLQYDECDEELAWAEKHYPGKIINFEDIDQYNDFDSVASLMKCMDLIVSTMTTPVELAGALGCPTWLLSNSAEIHWRKIENTDIDIWHNSITHIEGDILQNKASLIAKLTMKMAIYKQNE